MKKKTPIILFIGIIFLGFLLRAQELLFNNYLFLIDQGRDMMAVGQIVFEGKPTLIGPYTSLQGVFQGPLYYYLIAIPTFFFGGDPVGPLLLTVLLSVLVICVIYFWVRALFGAIAAVIASFLVAFSPQAIAAATFTWNPHSMWILVLVYLLSFFQSGKNKKYILITIPVISLMFHFQTALGVFTLIATILYLLFFARNLLFSKTFLFASILGLLFFIPQLLFELRHNFLMSKSVLKILQGSNQGLLVEGESGGYLQLVKQHVHELYINFSSVFFTDNYIKGVIPIFILFILFGSALIIKKGKKSQSYDFIKFSIRLLCIFLFLFVLLYPFVIRYWFLTGFQIFYILILSVLVSYFWKNNVLKFFVLLFSVIILALSFIKIHELYFLPPDDGGVAKMKGKKEAIDYIYKDAHGKDFGLFIFTPPVYTYAYDYILWWHGEKTYGFIPQPEKKETFYLLIEPDSGKPWSYKGWMETVIQDGTVIETIMLPSGFIIQKRKI